MQFLSRPAPLTDIVLAESYPFRYNTPMSDLQWNSVTVEKEDVPRVTIEDLREMAADLDPDDFDEPVQNFLEELDNCADSEELKQAATLLLQDEVDLSPALAAMGVEPDEKLIALLIATGANVNARNAYGQPPLHLAAHYGYESIVEMLISAGADLRVKNAQGRFAAEVAATHALHERLAPPYHPDDDTPLPAHIEDADIEAPDDAEDGEHACSCGHHHEGECSCGKRH